MNKSHPHRKDHLISLAVSCLLNGFLLFAMMWFLVSTPQPPPPLSTLLVLEPEQPLQIEDPEEVFVEPATDPLLDTETPFRDFEISMEMDLALDVTDPVPMPGNPDLNQLAALLSDIASPVSMIGLTSGVPAGGGATGFGGSGGSSADLVGTLWDLKRDSRGNNRRISFNQDLRRMLDADFSGPEMRDFFRVPRQVFLSHLFVPIIRAESGPEAFGVADQMEPRGWVIHYQGYIQPQVPGTFRFVGEFDDVILVRIDGQVVLESNWGGRATDWRPQEPLRGRRGLRSRDLVYGDWIQLENRPHRIEIVIGENPGGHVGGLLLVQDQNQTYRQTPSGHPILPLFTLHPFTAEDLARIEQKNFEIETRRVPLFGIHRTQPQPARAPRNDDDLIRITL